jgi:hypothetical protein
MPQIYNGIQLFESQIDNGNASEKIFLKISEHISDLKAVTICLEKEVYTHQGNE